MNKQAVVAETIWEYVGSDHSDRRVGRSHKVILVTDSGDDIVTTSGIESWRGDRTDFLKQFKFLRLAQ